MLKPTLGQNGYFFVTLKGDHNQRSPIHHLVLETFVGPRPKGMECRHLDGNSQNNHLSNLKWGTRSENQRDSVVHGTKYTHFKKGHSMNVGTNNPTAKLTEDDVRKIKELRGKLSQQKRAKMFGVSPSTIQNIDDGRTWSHIDV